MGKKSEIRNPKSETKRPASVVRCPLPVASNKVTSDEKTCDSSLVTRHSPLKQDNGRRTTDNPQLHARLIGLLPYQIRWVKDDSPLKIAVKARQIGYSFAATLRIVFECLKRKTTWILLSKGERQSRELMEKVQGHIQGCGTLAETDECIYFEGTSLKQLETRFPNGSVIYALPANPDTARGYSGNVTLDEFAFHQDADKIYAALYPTVTRGYQLEVISTPNGPRGKFYELAKSAGLADQGVGIQESGVRRKPSHESVRLASDSCLLTPDSSHWSPHACDIYEAVRQGLDAKLQQLRAGCEDDVAWRQEFCCQFVSSEEDFFAPELIASCVSSAASTEGVGSRELEAGKGERGTSASSPQEIEEWAEASHGERPSPSYSQLSTSSYFLGIDIGRKHDRTVFWVDEVRESKMEPLSDRAIESFEELEIRNQKSEENRPLSVVRSPSSVAAHVHEMNTQFQLRATDHGRRTTDVFASLATRHLPLATGVEPRTNLPNGSTARWPDGSISVTRLVKTLSNTPFDEQLNYARELLSLRGGNGAALITRAAIDATGIGAPLAESLAQEFGPRVEPVVFTAAVKEDLAYRTRRRMENGQTLLPDARDIRRAFAAVKKFVTVTGNLRFDAARTDAGHADEFWAKALADYAAEPRPAAHHEDGFLADARPFFSHSEFFEPAAVWTRGLFG